ncbi:MAG: hypothetical protein H0U74_06295 [Bradymonadaceae bacterium]|nr:hypothetical protein [Lujinxingiaceae bacterium]
MRTKHIALMIVVMVFMASLVACSSPTRRGKGGGTSDDVVDEASSVDDASFEDIFWPDLGGEPDADNPLPTLCGNGVLDPNETCDPAIASGPGACPTECATDDLCLIARLVGDPLACRARCALEPITECRHNDGCCAVGCTAAQDNDCSASCGDGILDQNENCDPGIPSGPGACPTSCSTSDACTDASLVGSAPNCTARCTLQSKTACIDGDGCCPSGCHSGNDNDCTAVCGNGIVEPGESCDGNCPTSCTGNACTSYAMSGSPANCNVVCTSSPITLCRDNDGCCPSGCTSANDNNCVPNQTGSATGSPCTSAATCSGGASATCASADFKDGYCTRSCTDTTNCPGGSHCAALNTTENMCIKSCTLDSHCRSDGYRCYDPNGGTTLGCWPSGLGNGAVGAACAGVYQCAGGNNAVCIHAWSGGYCSLKCVAGDGTCPTGSICDGFIYAPNRCLKSCTSGLNCRPGYNCSTTFFFGDVCTGS